LNNIANPEYAKSIKRYLELEWNSSTKEYTVGKWIGEEWEIHIPKDLPQQKNGCDCGVFVCMFCEHILNGCELNFKQDDVMEGSWRQKMILSPYSMQ